MILLRRHIGDTFACELQKFRSRLKLRNRLHLRHPLNNTVVGTDKLTGVTAIQTTVETRRRVTERTAVLYGKARKTTARIDLRLRICRQRPRWATGYATPAADAFHTARLMRCQVSSGHYGTDEKI